jgi:hypothetical protein
MRALLLAGLFAAVGLSVHAQGLQLGGQYWEMKPSGTLSVGRDGRAGTRIDLGKDLGFRSEDNVLGFDLVLGSGNEIALSYLDAELSANSRFSIPVEFGGTSFPTTTRIRSELEARLIRLAYRYQSGSHGFRGGFLAGIQQASVDAEVTSSRSGSGSGDASATAPVVGINFRIDPSPLFRIDAGIIGGVWDWDDTNLAFWDAAVSLRVNIRPFLVGIGYRQVSLDAEDGGLPIEADLRFKGPFLEAGLLF